MGGKWAEKKQLLANWTDGEEQCKTSRIGPSFTLWKIAKFSILRIFDLTIIKVPEVLFSIRSVAKLCWRVLLNLWRWNFLVWPDSPDFLNEKLFSYNLGFYFLHVVFVKWLDVWYELEYVAGVEAFYDFRSGMVWIHKGRNCNEKLLLRRMEADKGYCANTQKQKIHIDIKDRQENAFLEKY